MPNTNAMESDLMPEFYQTEQFSEPLPEPKINPTADPIPSAPRNYLAMPTTAQGMKEFSYIHTGQALVELDRVVTALTSLGEKKQLRVVVKAIEALEVMRDEIVPPARKYANKKDSA